jgi:hypothetical protein
MDREPVDWSARAARRGVSFAATVRLADGREVRALVSNLSYERCQLIAEAELFVGDTIVLNLPDRGWVEGQVRWTADDRAGVRFLSDSSEAENGRARIGA